MDISYMIERLKTCKPDVSVYYDFCCCTPDGIDSWRGIYAELALGWRPPDGKPMKVAALISLLESAIGRTFIGYKGGDFKMHAHTRVHCDNYGKATNTEIVGVVDLELFVILETRHVL